MLVISRFAGQLQPDHIRLTRRTGLADVLVVEANAESKKSTCFLYAVHALSDVFILILLRSTSEVAIMALQIVNPAVVSKVERLAKVTGLSKTAVVERAVDRLLSETVGIPDQIACMTALLDQLDRIPDRADAFDPLPWDQHGLPA